jgi:hypothetical protein
MKQRLYLHILTGLVLSLAACDKPAEKAAPPEHAWLKGNEYERIDKVAEHLRGNDVVMWEVAHRHRELYEAIVSDNRDYALYQLEKISLTMQLGAERRPKRKASYDWFFTHAVPPMKQAIETGDKDSRLAAYQTYTAACTTCHGMEKVPFMPVARPWEEGGD